MRILSAPLIHQSTVPLFRIFNSVADDPVDMTAGLRKAKITDEHRREAQALRDIWQRAKRPSQAVFGETFGIGGQSAVNNFLKGNSALSMKAAKGFAQGLGCEIAEFSPRLAAEAAELSAVSGQTHLSNLASPTQPDCLLSALSVLCDAIDTADELTRAQLAPLFSIMASDPTKSHAAAERINNLLSVVSERKQIPENKSSSWEAELDLGKWKRDDGQSAGVQGGRRAA